MEINIGEVVWIVQNGATQDYVPTNVSETEVELQSVSYPYSKIKIQLPCVAARNQARQIEQIFDESEGATGFSRDTCKID